MDFLTLYRQMSPAQREAFASKVCTTVGYLHQLAYGGKRIELGLADAIVATAPAFGAEVTLAELNLTERAKAHDAVRRGEEVGAGVHGSAVCAATPEST